MNSYKLHYELLQVASLSHLSSLIVYPGTLIVSLGLISMQKYEI